MELKDLIQIEIPKLALFVPELIVLITGFVLFSLDLIYKRLSHTLAISVSVIATPWHCFIWSLTLTSQERPFTGSMLGFPFLFGFSFL